jgi:tetrahydromethanopterin S-methyltransferase subunit G
MVLYVQSTDATPQGQPFQQLQAQIDDLQDQISNLAGGGGFTVVDNTGKKIGSIVGVMQGTRITIVVLPINGQLFPLEVLRDGYVRGGGLFFTSTDCTGQAYVPSGTSPFLETRVLSPGNTLHGESGPAQLVNLQSRFEEGAGCFAGEFSTTVVPMNPLIDLDTEFTPPFRVTGP